MFAVFATFKLIEQTIRKWPETLRAYETLRMPQLTLRVDNLVVRVEAVPAAGARHVTERHGYARHRDLMYSRYSCAVATARGGFIFGVL